MQSMSDQARIARARRRLARMDHNGYILRKSRTRNPGRDDEGGYSVIDAGTQQCVEGDRCQLDLEGVEAAIDRLKDRLPAHLAGVAE